MAKAVFQRNQKVWVESVGAWAIIERIEPIWAKGFEEPVKVTYDVGLGRPFLASELRAEDPVDGSGAGADSGWRLMRARNKWQSLDECSHHPYPGTYPVVVTDTTDWGGWRVPGSEYDRDPRKIEMQSRLVACAPALRGLARELVGLFQEAPHDTPSAVQDLARKAMAIERFIAEMPSAGAASGETAQAAE